MNIFRKIFSLSKRDDNQTKIVSKKYPNFCKAEQELIERYGGIAFDKQIDLSEIIGTNNWSLDMVNQEIDFGNDLVFPFQVLGFFSRSSQEWRWAWATEQAQDGNRSLVHALQLKQYGEQNKIGFLKTEHFQASNIDLHLIGLTASGMLKSSGYYIADYGKGAMVFTLKSEIIDALVKNEHERILNVFPHLISDFDINHKAALKYYLEEKGYQTTVNKHKLIGTKERHAILAEFTKDDVLTKLTG